jgi:hypothetical protein
MQPERTTRRPASNVTAWAPALKLPGSAYNSSRATPKWRCWQTLPSPRSAPLAALLTEMNCANARTTSKPPSRRSFTPPPDGFARPFQHRCRPDPAKMRQPPPDSSIRPRTEYLSLAVFAATKECSAHRRYARQPDAASSRRWPRIAVRSERPLPAGSSGWLTAWRLSVWPAAAITGTVREGSGRPAVGPRRVRAASGPAPFRFGDGVGRIGVSRQERGPGAGSAEGATGTGGPGRRAG